MKPSPEFLEFGRWFLQDLDRLAPTEEEAYRFVLEPFKGEARVRLRNFIDKALREASDDELMNL